MLNPRRTHKKGSKGIGVLFLFIALLFIAVSVSALIFYNAEKLAEHGKKNLEKTEGQFKHIQIVEVAGYDGRDQILTELTVDAKLSMNSKPIDLRELSISIGEEDYRSMLAYRGYDAPIEESNDGYNTWTDQEFGELGYTVANFNPDPMLINPAFPYPLPLDLDGDGMDDILNTCDGSNCPSEYDGTHLKFTLSGGGVAYAELRNSDGSLAHLDVQPATVDVIRSPILGAQNNKVYGKISVEGTTNVAYELGSSINLTLNTNGYELDADVDDDGETDYMGLNATHFIFHISSHDDPLSYPLGVDLSAGSQTLDVDRKVTNENRYGTITAQGETDADKIDADVDVQFDPYHNGQGYYVAEHLIRADDNSREYYMLPGDVVRFHVEAYRNISTDEIIKIRYFYHNLESPPKDIYVGNTFPNKRKVDLYPNP
ncbi:flagellin [Candidatus Woesearchaeota archaeon]|nr:flagellin [Candidatus Woesearchaeota archaeon]